MPKSKKPPEQLAQELLARELIDCRESFRKTQPTIQYSVGERVQRGHIKQSIITEILDGGQILKLHEIITEPNYGDPYDYERDSYVCWHNVVPYRSNEDNNKIPIHRVEDELELNYSQRSIDGIFTVVYRFGLDMSPEYQRPLVWSQEDKEALIDSIFHHIDIGKFVFVKRPYNTEQGKELYEILDGKQRISALIDFYEGRFTYKGKTFAQLSFRDQYHFTDYSISWAEINDCPLKTKLTYFLRVNTFGKPQDQAHLDAITMKLRELNQGGF